MNKIIKKGWNEFSSKNVFHLIKDDLNLNLFLPTEEMKNGLWPDKEFFGVFVFLSRLIGQIFFILNA